MRVSRETMARHHQEIVARATTMLRERGVDGLSVADLMQSAGLTHGGFYRHFASKDALVAEATTATFTDFIDRIASKTAAGDPRAALRGYIDDYLSAAHIENPSIGCPIAAYGADIARQPAIVRTAYGEGLEGLTATIAGCLEGSPTERRQRAQAILACMVGAVVTARAAGDTKTVQAYLAAARTTTNELLNKATSRRRT